MRIAITPTTRLYVDIEGCGLVPDGLRMREKPTLLLVHGGPGFDHSSFKPLFSRLADIAQVVYFDLRGHGRSDRCPPDEWTLDTFADDIVHLCDALGIHRPIVLGQSFGGFVAQRYLARHPAHPAKVILSSTAPALGLARKLAMFERLGGPAARDAAETFWTRPDAQTWAHYAEVCWPLYNPSIAPNDHAKRRVITEPEILFTHARGEMRGMNLLPGLAAVRCPVLVMAGALDPVCPLADSQDIAAALPAPWGRLVTFDDAGHGVWRDQPDAALALLLEFITSAAPADACMTPP